MKRKRFSEEQIIAILREHEAGVPTADLCRKHGMSSASFYAWKAKFGGIDVSDAQKLSYAASRRCWVSGHSSLIHPGTPSSTSTYSNPMATAGQSVTRRQMSVAAIAVPDRRRATRANRPSRPRCSQDRRA